MCMQGITLSKKLSKCPAGQLNRAAMMPLDVMMELENMFTLKLHLHANRRQKVALAFYLRCCEVRPQAEEDKSFLFT